MMRLLLPLTLFLLLSPAVPVSRGRESPEPTKRNFPYRELEGVVEEFRFTRNWRSYYWREDFTLLLRDDEGKQHRIISREPTPWNNLRLGTTYTGLAVDWTGKPRVKVIGVLAVDRIPADFYDVKLDEGVITAFIVRVQTRVKDAAPVWSDFFVNNWFHDWGAEANRKVLPHYANDNPHYVVYGYLSGATTPLDEESKKVLAKYEAEYNGVIYGGRIVPAKNELGYAIKLTHLLGRHKKTLDYAVYYGNPAQIHQLDGKAPPEARKK